MQLNWRNESSAELLPPSAPSNGNASYVLATGARAVRRLHLLHDIYSPAGRRVLVKAGLTEGMRVADFGCGVGVVSSMLAHMVGPSGSVTGIDVNRPQLEEARHLCSTRGYRNTTFIAADATDTGLERGSYDLAYCRFLLLHLPDPASCLREMYEVLKPGGILVVEDGDLASAGSSPNSGCDEFATLFSRYGAVRGLDYSLAKNLYQMVTRAGFIHADMEIHQPAMIRGETRYFLKWSVEEAAPALIQSGVTTAERLNRSLYRMQQAIDDPNVVILAPRMSLVWAQKPHR